MALDPNGSSGYLSLWISGYSTDLGRGFLRVGLKPNTQHPSLWAVCDNPSRGTPAHGPQGEDLGSSLTNNLIMEIVRSHSGGVGVGALQRCEPGVHGQVFHGTGCHKKSRLELPLSFVHYG
ncbi:Uncharacterized protein Rs2_04594 [Raphanus sativus]|nr:Uncharacterized protein Rs2_04594 [Raphanus sativus]